MTTILRPTIADDLAPGDRIGPRRSQVTAVASDPGYRFITVTVATPRGATTFTVPAGTWVRVAS